MAQSGDKTPRPKINDRGFTVTESTSRNLTTPSPGTLKGGDTGGAPPAPSSRARSASISKTNLEGSKPQDKIEFRYEECSNSNSDCVGTRAGCITESGNPNYFQPPTITYYQVNDGPWQGGQMTCGVPESVAIPQGPGEPPQIVQVEPPPVPSLAQIQTAFRELPFSKPTVSVEPQGMKTLKNLKTFYAADWPDNSGLQPGEISKPVKLLSWTIEFKVAAQDYRYDFGDGTTSEWTSSTGGTYPAGDITHTYKGTGDMEIKVDARLTGEYRVGGGPWQDIATTADLQDEPVDTLQVLGTKTRLVSDEG